MNGKLEPPPAPASQPRASWKILAALLGLGGSLLSAELALRIADGLGWIGIWEEVRVARTASIWSESENPRLVYRHRPDYHKEGVRITERHGILRPTDVAIEAPAGTFRIALLGDSVAAAIELPYEQRMSTLVQEALAGEVTGDVEVLNFAVNGYNTLQEAMLLEELASRFDPDLLILQYCVNDFHPSGQPLRFFVRQSPSYAVEFLRYQLMRLHPGFGYPPAEYWEELYRTDDAGWDSVSRGFDRVIDYARKQGIKALLVIFPTVSHGGWFEGDAVGRHERVAKLARSSGLDVLDLLPVYAKQTVEELRFKPWDTFHPNALGHRLAAEAIVGKLSEMGSGGDASRTGS
jgi:lysophospholipase L1-like esterase